MVTGLFPDEIRFEEELGLRPDLLLHDGVVFRICVGHYEDFLLLHLLGPAASSHLVLALLLAPLVHLAMVGLALLLLHPLMVLSLGQGGVPPALLGGTDGGLLEMKHD